MLDLKQLKPSIVLCERRSKINLMVSMYVSGFMKTVSKKSCVFFSLLDEIKIKRNASFFPPLRLLSSFSCSLLSIFSSLEVILRHFGVVKSRDSAFGCFGATS